MQLEALKTVKLNETFNAAALNESQYLNVKNAVEPIDILGKVILPVVFGRTRDVFKLSDADLERVLDVHPVGIRTPVTKHKFEELPLERKVYPKFLIYKDVIRVGSEARSPHNAHYLTPLRCMNQLFQVMTQAVGEFTHFVIYVYSDNPAVSKKD